MTEPLCFVEETLELNNSVEAALFLLHGIGSNEYDLLPLATSLGSELHVLSFRAPLTAGPGRYMWYPLLNGGRGPEIDLEAATSARDAVLASVRQYKALHPGRPVFLLGFSQGAALSLIIALTSPGEIDGAICFSGRFPLEFESAIPNDRSLAGANVWVSHGTSDNAIPIVYGRAVQALLQRLKVSHIYQEFHARHEITQPMVADARLWLSQQLRSMENNGQVVPVHA